MLYLNIKLLKKLRLIQRVLILNEKMYQLIKNENINIVSVKIIQHIL